MKELVLLGGCSSDDESLPLPLLSEFFFFASLDSSRPSAWLLSGFFVGLTTVFFLPLLILLLLLLLLLAVLLLLVLRTPLSRKSSAFVNFFFSAVFSSRRFRLRVASESLELSDRSSSSRSLLLLLLDGPPRPSSSLLPYPVLSELGRFFLPFLSSSPFSNSTTS